VKRNEQTILLGVAVVGLLIAFWLVILGPKRNEASKLQDEIDDVQSSLTQAQQEVAAAKSASRSFGMDYRRLVVLGKAVPADSDQASLLVQLQDLADRSGVQFQTIDLAAGTATAPPPPATTTSTDSTSSDASTDTSASSGTASADPALASEAAVSTLPIGAAVGAAGLPVMPYSLGFTGGFFEIADFMARLDGMVDIQDGLVDVRGRLLTIDGFTLTASPSATGATPELSAELNVTSFLSPADQGITAGATPTGPAPPTTTPAGSTTTSTSSTAPTDTSSTATSTPTSTSP
jgi:Tfp pilus assembly protein PilO